MGGGQEGCAAKDRTIRRCRTPRSYIYPPPRVPSLSCCLWLASFSVGIFTISILTIDISVGHRHWHLSPSASPLSASSPWTSALDISITTGVGINIDIFHYQHQHQHQHQHRRLFFPPPRYPRPTMTKKKRDWIFSLFLLADGSSCFWSLMKEGGFHFIHRCVHVSMGLGGHGFMWTCGRLFMHAYTHSFLCSLTSDTRRPQSLVALLFIIFSFIPQPNPPPSPSFSSLSPAKQREQPAEWGKPATYHSTCHLPPATSHHSSVISPKNTGTEQKTQLV